MRASIVSLALALSILACACRTEPIDSADAGVPDVHRPVATECTTPPPPTPYTCAPQPDQVNRCGSDADCTMGRNGRCIIERPSCNCVYDDCVSDSDCPQGQLCDCRSPYSWHDAHPARCLPSNCRTDADCGPGGYCSPSLDPECGSFFGVTGWYCHTAADECVNDRDCAGIDAGGPTPFCAYRPEVGHWVCSTSFCAG